MLKIADPLSAPCGILAGKSAAACSHYLPITCEDALSNSLLTSQSHPQVLPPFICWYIRTASTLLPEDSKTITTLMTTFPNYIITD
jgi:hypothetical protein